MFIWVGIDVDSQLTQIKEKTRAVERALMFAHSNFTLPLHISLKISFPIDDGLFPEVLRDIEKIYEETESFDIAVEQIRYEGNISWILMQKNENLIALSKKINDCMLAKYGVPLHEYDLDYKFHTTLFMDNDAQKVKNAYLQLQHMAPPKALRAHKFVIGVSETGKLGSFRVYKEIIKTED